jgi:AcrR family transcriptional regulator
MNRIYQGRVSKVEIPDGKGEQGKPADYFGFGYWSLIIGDSAQPPHHELFQDAVNYYTLALAALAADLQPDTPKGKAALAWREQVRENWLDGFRKAVRYDGPHKRLARWLNVDASINDEHAAFDAAAKAILKANGSSATQRGKALLQLLEEADQSDLNQLCVSRLLWLCTP